MQYSRWIFFVRLDAGRRINRKNWTPLPMPKEVVDQVHRLARCAKAKQNLMFTNRHNQDLDVLYAALSDEDDEDEPTNNDNDSLAGVNNMDNADKDDNKDGSDYNPSHDNDDVNDDDDNNKNNKNINNNNNNNNNSTTNNNEANTNITDDAPEEEIENPGVDDNAEDPVMDDEELETPGVDDDTVTEETDVETSGVGDDEPQEAPESTGVGNNAPNNDNEEETNERTYQMMNLRQQDRKEYNVFNNIGEEETGGIMLLEFSQDDTDLEESEFNRINTEYMFLTETLGWKEGIDETHDKDPQTVIILAECQFIIEQMGW